MKKNYLFIFYLLIININIRFAGGRSVAMKRNKELQEQARSENNRINKYKIPNESHNNSLDEIRIDFSI